MNVTTPTAAVLRASGYVPLPNFLHRDDCEELTKVLLDLVASGRSRRDEQCPQSDSVRDVAVLDSLLEQLLPNVEAASGRRLYPTYAYARVYRAGEVLRVHKDRPSCEISVTLMLGSDGTPWPLFVADGEMEETGDGHARDVHNVQSVTMRSGDAVLYRGCDKLHWREKFDGEWHAQVFLHYVDADGPHADWKYDRRPRLAHHPISCDVPNFLAVPDAVTRDSCPRIVAECERHALEQAGVGGSTTKVDRSIRDVRKVLLPVHRGIAVAMAGIGLHANRHAWRFDVSYADQCEFLRYDEAGHYHAHVDSFFDPTRDCRKLTVLLFLNDDYEGGRLFVQTSHERTYPPQSPGTVLVFPSFLLHGVEPVTKGVRRSLVTWLVGPWFK